LGFPLIEGCNSNDEHSALEEAIDEEFDRYPAVPKGFDKASTDFDISELSAFLPRVSAFIDSGFGPSEIQEIVRTAKK
jgi:hypothetical protein